MFLKMTELVRPMKLGALFSVNPLHIMPGGKTIGTKIARGGQKVGELHRLVTANTGNRGLAAHIAVGEILHHLVMEAAFVIEDIVRDAKPSSDRARIVDIGTGTAGPLGLNGDTMIIELQCNADDLEPLLVEQCRCHRAVDPAGHRNNDPRVSRRLGKPQRIDSGIRAGVSG